MLESLAAEIAALPRLRVSEAACLLARESDQAKRFLARQQKKHGKRVHRVGR